MNNPQAQGKKRPYSPPKLRVHGKVRTLTQGGTLNGVDGGISIVGVSTKMNTKIPGQ